MAHISKGGKLKDGSTVWRAPLPDPDRPGGTAQLERTFRTRQEAQDWLTEQSHSINSGTYISPAQAKRPFKDVLTAWQETHTNLSPTTADRYEQILRIYLVPEFGNQPTSQITHERVQRYINQLTQKHAPGTVRNIFTALRAATSQGVRLGMLKTNPTQSIVLPKSPREEMLFLTTEQ